MEIVGEFDGGTAVGFIEFADEVERIEGRIAVGIAVAEIVGKQGAPTGAEADAASGMPLALV